MKHDEIMLRIKRNYESRSKTYLTRRTPVIIRLDGKAFHTYTKGLNKPFDEGLIQDMQSTAIYLCQHIQGAKCAYTQSDEISILVTDFDTLTTDAWFDYNVQKMTSVSASLATGVFNELRAKKFHREVNIYQVTDYHQKLAFFDSRVFNIPPDEVGNYFYARQRDAVKNSVAMLAQSLYSHSELHEKNGNEMQEMCFQKGHNWNDLHWSKKRGSFIVKNTYVDEHCLSDRDAKGNKSVEFFTDLKYAIFDENVKDWVALPNQVLRTKWEVIETPERFALSNFINFVK